MANGKGDKQRRSQVSRDAYNAEWERIFKGYATCGDCAGAGEVGIGDCTAPCPYCVGTGRLEVPDER